MEANMKKFLIVLLTLVLLTFSIFACNNAGSSASNTSGKVLEINLGTNPTTGYDWEYEMTNNSDDAAIIVFVEAYEEFTNQDKGLVGAPILRHYKFKAEKLGKQNIKFTYKRNWEGGDTAYSLIYELTVDKDNTIHVDNVLTEGASQNNMLSNDYNFEN